MTQLEMIVRETRTASLSDLFQVLQTAVDGEIYSAYRVGIDERREKVIRQTPAQTVKQITVNRGAHYYPIEQLPRLPKTIAEGQFLLYVPIVQIGYWIEGWHQEQPRGEYTENLYVTKITDFTLDHASHPFLAGEESIGVDQCEAHTLRIRHQRVRNLVMQTTYNEEGLLFRPAYEDPLFDRIRAVCTPCAPAFFVDTRRKI
jgi:hypothetical protein